MYTLNEQQIDFILDDIHARGIRMESLQCDLLDHICVIIEQKLDKEEDFEKCYGETIRTFYRKELVEIEKETLFLLSSRNRVVLSRNQFFLLLLILFIGPFVAYDLNWMVDSGPVYKWHLPADIWAPTIVFSLFPLLTLMVLFFTPERLDPLIPSKSKILLGLKPFIKIIPVQ